MSRILVIDDDAQVRTLFEEVLGRAGYAVETAESGDKGLELFHETPADLAIVDVLLPGKDGLVTILELQHALPGVKVIAMSGGFQKRTNPTFATGGGDSTELAENWPLTPKGLHQSQSLSSSPF